MKKLLNILFILSCAALIYYYVQQTNNKHSHTTTQAADTLIVGTSADYPPYEKIDLNTGEIVGFDIDVISEIAHRLGKKIVLQDMPFNSLMLNLTANQIDLVAAGLSESEERKNTALFSDSYLQDDYMVIITAQGFPVTNVTDLYGKTVAVNTGYNADKYLSTMPEIKLIRLDSPADSILALQAKSVDAVATSKSSYTLFTTQNNTAHIYRYFAIPDSAEHCAFAFAKHNSSLQEKINAALQSMKEDGTLTNLQKKWGFLDELS